MAYYKVSVDVSDLFDDMLVHAQKSFLIDKFCSLATDQQVEGGEVLFDEYGGYCCVTGEPEYKPYTHVLFINGYRKDSPRIEKEIESITIGKPKKGLCPDKWLGTEFLLLSLSDMKVKNLPKKIYLNICSNEDEVDYNELNGVTFSTEKIGVTDCDTENVPYVNAASLWHDLKEEKPPLKKWVMFRYSGGGVNPTALHYGAMSDDIWVVTRGDGTQRIEVLYECYDKIEWLDFDELK